MARRRRMHGLGFGMGKMSWGAVAFGAVIGGAAVYFFAKKKEESSTGVKGLGYGLGLRTQPRVKAKECDSDCMMRRWCSANPAHCG